MNTASRCCSLEKIWLLSVSFKCSVNLLHACLSLVLFIAATGLPHFDPWVPRSRTASLLKMGTIEWPTKHSKKTLRLPAITKTRNHGFKPIRRLTRRDFYPFHAIGMPVWPLACLFHHISFFCFALYHHARVEEIVVLILCLNWSIPQMNVVNRIC